MIWLDEDTCANALASKVSCLTARVVVAVSFIVSFVLLLGGFEYARAEDRAVATGPQHKNAQEPAKTEQDSEPSLPKLRADGPLVIPVFPRGNLAKDTPVSTDLHDSYIVMQDGSVLSVADWILGSLNKSKIGAGMSDYENRLFLGQVARAMVGMDENLVNNSLIYTRPTVSYRPTAQLPVSLQVLQGVITMVFPNLLNYDPTIGPNPATNLSPRIGANDRQTTVSFDRSFSEALERSSGDFREHGIMQNMVDEQRKKLAKERAAKE